MSKTVDCRDGEGDGEQSQKMIQSENLEDIKKVNLTWMHVLPQIISACIAHTLVMQVGIHMTYSTVQIPYLNLTTGQSSWLASLVTITNPIGALCIGPVMDWLGRKYSLLLVCVPFAVSSAITILSAPDNLGLLYLSKICAGVGSGMSTVAMVYVSEISHGDYRPALLCLNSVFVSFGILLTTILNLYLDWRSLSICFLGLITVSGFLLTCVTPESPHWLINLDRRSNRNMRMVRAEASLKYLNPNLDSFRNEWQVLNQVRLNHDQSNEGSLLKNIFKSKQCYKPLTVLLILFTLQQFTGVYPVIFYAMQIFKKVGSDFGPGIHESQALVFLGALRFTMSCFTTVLARSFGRKQLLIVSAAGLCIFSFLLSANLMLKSSNETCPVHPSGQLLNVSQSLYNGSQTVSLDTSLHANHHLHNASHQVHHNLSSGNSHFNTSCTPNQSHLTSDRLSLLCILMYVCFSAVGVIVIPWTMIGELLPSYARGTCSGFLISYGYLCMFVMVKSFPFSLQYSTIGSFNVFGLVSFVLIWFVYYYLPETKGKTLVEIENFFS